MLFLRPTGSQLEASLLRNRPHVVCAGSSLEQGHRFHAVVTAKPVVWLVTARLYPLLVAVLAVSFIVLSNLAASDVPSWLAVVWLASAVCIVVCELTRFDRQVLRALLGSFEVLYLLANMLLFVAFKAWSQLDDVPLAVKCLRSAAVLWLPLLVRPAPRANTPACFLTSPLLLRCCSTRPRPTRCGCGAALCWQPLPT